MEKNLIQKYEYLVIESKVLNDTRLTGNEKLFYSLIVSLSKNYGYCFATNKMLSELIETFIDKCKSRQVINYLSKLKDLEYIKIINDKTQRKIYPVTIVSQNIDNKEVFNYDWLTDENLTK